MLDCGCAGGVPAGANTRNETRRRLFGPVFGQGRTCQMRCETFCRRVIFVQAALRR